MRDYDRRTATNDLKAEFILRKMEPPYDLVRDDFERYVAETDRAFAELRADDPAEFEKMTQGVNENLETFRSFRDKSKN
jgi:hypothetical protein